MVHSLAGHPSVAPVMTTGRAREKNSCWNLWLVRSSAATLGMGVHEAQAEASLAKVGSSSPSRAIASVTHLRFAFLMVSLVLFLENVRGANPAGNFECGIMVFLEA